MVHINQFSSLASLWWTWKTTWLLWKRSSKQLRRWLRSCPLCLMNMPKSDLVAYKSRLEISSPYIYMDLAIYPMRFQ